MKKEHKSAKEFYNTKYPNHTRLLKRWVIELMEAYAQSTTPTEGEIEEEKRLRQSKLPSEKEIRNIIGEYARRFCKGFDANIIAHDSAKAIVKLFKD